MIPTFLLFGGVIGVVVALGTGRIARSPADDAPFPRAWLLLPLALAPQFLWIHLLSHLPSASGLSWLLTLSYLPVLVFLAVNAHHAWARVILLGLLLNFAASAANGGTMPARLPATDVPVALAPETTDRIAPGTKDRVMPASRSFVLEPLADRYVLSLPGGAQRLTSIGDLVILLGGSLALLSFVVPRRPTPAPIEAFP